MRGADPIDREAAAVRRYVEWVRRRIGAETTRDASPGELPERAEADLVVWWARRGVATVDAPIADLARTAKKGVVVVVRNPERLGHRGDRGDASGLARDLWAAGRVREHAYLAIPAWATALVAVARGVAPAEVVQAPAPTLVRRVAALHAFVVDTTPRTPQARRHLRVAAPRTPSDV